MLESKYIEISDTLRKHGLQVTSQRILIYDYLVHTTEHPTAQQVFEDVSRFLPGISKATVYNTLETLSSHGLIQKVNPQSGVTRYDGNTMLHSHLICTHCHRIVDCFGRFVEEESVPEGIWDGFKIERTCLIFYGICGECQHRLFSNRGENKRSRRKGRGEQVTPFEESREKVDAWLTVRADG